MPRRSTPPSRARARQSVPAVEWRSLLPAARARLLWKIADLIDENADELAALETRDQGQPIGISRNVSVPAAAEHFRYYAGWVTKIAGETNPLSFPNTFNYTLREPVGVCGLIIPWNFPLMITAWKVAPALACANTCVVKPAEQTPLTALRLAELIAEAGIPEGVVEVVTGGPAAGAALAEHPDVDKISFTGSTEVGRSVIRAAAGNFKRVSLELGGKNPAVVFDDAPLEAAVAGVLQGGAAQQRPGLRGLQPRLRAAARRGRSSRRRPRRRHRRMTVGPGLDAATQLGPLVTHEHRDSVERYIRLGVDEGAELLCGGERPGDELEARRVPHAGRVRRRRRRDDDRARGDLRPGRLRDAVRRRRRGRRARERHGLRPRRLDLDARRRARTPACGGRRAPGNVWVNMPNPLDAAAPWGGVKASGWGREMGKDAIDLYTEVKSVWVSLA